MKNKTMPSMQQHLASTNNPVIQQHDHNHHNHNQHHQQYTQQMQANHQHPHHTPQIQHQIDASQHQQQQQQQHQQQLQQLIPSVPMMSHQQMGSSNHQNGVAAGVSTQSASAAATSSSNQTVSSSSSSSSSSSNFVKKELPANGKKTKGRVRIKMEFIHNKLRRYTTFSKRKTGIMKKAFELATLTGTQVMLLVASETGHVYTFATRKLQPMIISDAGKALIQTCLNSPDSDNLLMSNAATSSGQQHQAQQQQQQQQNGTNVNNNSSSSSSSPMGNGGGAGSPASGAPGSLANNQLQLSAASSSLQMMGQQHQQAHQQHSSSNSSSAVHSPLGGLQPLSSPSQPQQQQAIMSHSNMSSNNNHQTNNKQHSAGALHQMGPTASPLAASVGIQSQHNVMLATGGNQQAGANRQAGCSANNNDQRMSATGFEEPELSYSIGDLDDRPSFTQCLPVKVASISGTLVSNVGANLQPAGGVSAPEPIPDKTNMSLLPANGADQQSLIGVPQFNYNPIYNGLGQQSGGVQQYVTRPEADCAARQTSYLSSSDLFMEDDDEAENEHANEHDNEHLLDEIYQFADEAHPRTPSKQLDLDCNQRRKNPGEIANERSSIYVDGDRSNQLASQLADGFNHDQTRPGMIINSHFSPNQVGKARAMQSHQQQIQAPTSRPQRRAMNSNHLMVSFQQPMASTSMSELHEDCGGLFVEYQTNRDPAGGSGGLEELHSLNVSNCDSETLEEQINLLSHDADLGFETNSELYQQDEYQDFALNNSNDHFLSMLFMNTNNTLQSVGQSSACNSLEASEAPSAHTFMQANSSLVSAPNEPPGGGVALAGNHHQPGSHTKKAAQQLRGPGKKVAGKRARSLIRTNPASCRDEAKVASESRSNNVQQTINKTNTNKQLMPRRGGAVLAPETKQSARQKAHMDNWPLSSNKLSPESALADSMVKSSKSLSLGTLNGTGAEEPYKQQLENLRKKLRMDLGPGVTLTSVTGKNVPTTAGKTSSAKTVASRADQGGVIDASSLDNQSQPGYIDALMLH